MRDGYELTSMEKEAVFFTGSKPLLDDIFPTANECFSLS